MESWESILIGFGAGIGTALFFLCVYVFWCKQKFGTTETP